MQKGLSVYYTLVREGGKKLEFLETNRRIQDFHKLKRYGCRNSTQLSEDI